MSQMKNMQTVIVLKRKVIWDLLKKHSGLLKATSLKT